MMKTICFMGENIYDIEEELDIFRLTHDVVSVIYRIQNEFCVAEITYI